MKINTVYNGYKELASTDNKTPPMLLINIIKKTNDN